MFSQTAEYALRAASVLAAKAPASLTTVEIATATQVPQAYLSKVIQALRKSGVVTSQRGIGGGVKLARDLEEISVLDIINAVDPIQRIHTCPLDLKTHNVNLCPLHRKLDNVMEQAETAFRNTTLAEILSESGSPKPLCDIAQPIEIELTSGK